MPRCILIFVISIFAMALLSRGMTAVAANDGMFQEQYVYLFSYFTNEGDGLKLCYSNDLYDWTDIPGSHPCPRIGDRIMRDPFIQHASDGTFHLVWTTGWARKDIGYSSSKDLVYWTEQRLIPVKRQNTEACPLSVWRDRIQNPDTLSAILQSLNHSRIRVNHCRKKQHQSVSNLFFVLFVPFRGSNIGTVTRAVTAKHNQNPCNPWFKIYLKSNLFYGIIHV
jgi:hypothetical protein